MSAEQARERRGAALDTIDAAHEVLRTASSDGVGIDLRVEVAERPETQERNNRRLMYRFFAEISHPPHPPLPARGPDPPDADEG